MPCCGQKRALAGARHAASSSLPSPVAQSANPRASVNDVPLRYAGPGQFTIRGQHSGRIYSCAAVGGMVLVDQNDVNSLLRTQLFVRLR